jgi:hypothetical protein
MPRRQISIWSCLWLPCPSCPRHWVNLAMGLHGESFGAVRNFPAGSAKGVAHPNAQSGIWNNARSNPMGTRVALKEEWIR